MDNQNYKNFTVKLNDQGVCRAFLDVPGRPLNVLDHEVMSELNDIVSRLEQRDDVRLFVFSSGKESGFLAGADVAEIQKIGDSKSGDMLLRRGQRLFERIERLPMKTLALIHGPCLGGGLELSLACSYRIARDNSSTKIGLPEIKLGLIPGWGGTQRLPKLVGIRQALKLILSGKHLSASDAAAIGLIDRAVAPDDWRDEVAAVIDRLRRSDPHFKRDRQFGWGTWAMDSNPIGRAFVLSATRKQLASKFLHYPAIPAAIRAVAASFHSHVDGYEVERFEFGRLVGTPTSRRLLKLFFDREAARKLSTWAPETIRVVHQNPIRNVGVIGAGAMGAGIAHVAATRGYEIQIKEMDDTTVQMGADRIEKLVDRYARHKRWDTRATGKLRNRIGLTDDWMKLQESDLIVEAVVERMDIKKQVLCDAESSVSKSAVLATNTSSLSVTKMANALEHPERFAGLHFFNPVDRMELVEVVRGELTNENTIARLVSFVRALGKTPIVTTDSPGFLVNRILFPYLGEAVLMAREGQDIELIDREIRNFGMPMGPLELLDQVGLDVALHVAKSLKSVLPDVDGVVDTLAPMVMRGDVGRKSGAGFYLHGRRKVPMALAATTTTEIEMGTGYHADGLTTIQRRLIYLMLAESMRCENESVVAQPWMIDVGMVLGTGFAPHLGGPISLINSIGEEKVRFNLKWLSNRHGIRFTPPKVSKTISP